MSYKSFLVNLNIDTPIDPLVQGAVDLAARFDAKLVGFCAADAPFPMIMPPEGGDIAVGWWRQQREDIESRFKEMRAEFERIVAGSVRTEWRAVVGDPTHTLVATSKVADLIVTVAPTETAIGNAYRTVDLGSLVLQSGRPLLVLTDKSRKIAIRKIVIAWKDTREARRAVADAIPLLAVANEVIVVTVASDPDKWDRDSIADVSTFLANHGIKARTEVIKTVDEGETLIEFATSCRADLVVSGAYGTVDCGNGRSAASPARYWMRPGSISSCQADLLSTATN